MSDLRRQMVFGTIDETITSWVMNDQKYDLMKLSPEVHRLIMNGMKAKSVLVKGDGMKWSF